MARVRNPETCPNTLSMLRFLPVIAKSSNATLRLVLWMLEPLPLQEPAETSVRNSTKHCGSGPSQPIPAHEIDLIQSGSIWINLVYYDHIVLHEQIACITQNAHQKRYKPHS